MIRLLQRSLRRARQLWLDRQERRFLLHHGCATREQYERWYDPRVNRGASRIRDYYHGYPYYHALSDPDSAHYSVAYTAENMFRFGFEDVYDWCQENLQGRFRYDFLRISDWNGATTSLGIAEWETSEFGSFDCVFFAFEREDDYLLFALRWGHG